MLVSRLWFFSDMLQNPKLESVELVLTHTVRIDLTIS